MIYLMRHGETAWNVELRLQGRLDSPLTEKGQRQGAAYGRRLSAERLALDRLRIVCSPLRRARHTAEIALAELGLPHDRIEIEPRLSEFAFGAWEGLNWEEIQRDHLESYERRKADRWNVRVPGGESFADVAVRVAAWLGEHDDGSTWLAISHGATARVIRGLYGGFAPPETMALPEPQDRIFRLSQGRIEEMLSYEE